jgi:hypothetical protein
MMNPPRIGFGKMPDRNISGSMWRYNVAGVLSQHQRLGTDLVTYHLVICARLPWCLSPFLRTVNLYN